MENTNQQVSDVERIYRNESIAVHWNPRRCIHSGNCVKRLPQVFQKSERPWIKVDAAMATEIADVIQRCPTGALHFERLDGDTQEQAAGETTIAPQPNGPLFVRGHVRIVGADGTVIREDTRMALCRCGQSHNKPFCDGTHRTVGFKTE